MAAGSADPRGRYPMKSRIALGRVMRHVIVWPALALAAMAAAPAPALPADDAPGLSHAEPLEANVVEEERLRTCSKIYEWPERFHCVYEFTVLARRIRELPNYSGVELKEDVERDIELTFEQLKLQFAVRG